PDTIISQCFYGFIWQVTPSNMSLTIPLINVITQKEHYVQVFFYHMLISCIVTGCITLAGGKGKVQLIKIGVYFGCGFGTPNRAHFFTSLKPIVVFTVGG